MEAPDTRTVLQRALAEHNEQIATGNVAQARAALQNITDYQSEIAVRQGYIAEEVKKLQKLNTTPALDAAAVGLATPAVPTV